MAKTQFIKNGTGCIAVLPNGVKMYSSTPCPTAKTAKLRADGGDDNKILITLLSNYIIDYPHQVVSLLSKHGFAVPVTASHKDIAAKVSLALHKSKTFTSAFVASLQKAYGVHSIVGASKRVEPSRQTPINADGDTGSSFQSGLSNISTAISDTTGLINGLGNLFGGKQKAAATATSNQAQASAAQAQAQTAQAQLQAEMLKLQQQKKGKSNIGLYVGIGIGVAVLIGATLFIVRSMKQKATA